MAWLILLVAGILEVAWAVGLKYTEGFTKLWPSLATATCIVISLFLLSVALKTIPIGTGYAIWTGIGTVGTVIVGILVFQEPATFTRLACVGLILVGIVGLKLNAIA